MGEPPQAVRRSPLGHLAAELRAASVPGTVTVREVPFVRQVNVRGPGGKPFPAEPNTVATTGDAAGDAAGDAEGDTVLVWLGPDEWLVVGPGEVPGMPGAEHESVADVSAHRTVVELAGPAAREVLLKGCPIDLHPGVFPPGRCAQTLLGRAQVIIVCVDERPAYRLFVRASLAGYLAGWLIDAMREYQCHTY
ncbi:sarcosine oxidase subunit gamma family protein [Streptosporangium soli]|nr:sarcosine oxidase subunit gamma [Streptosporangium sp. KLBMP 9127]